MTYYKIWNRSRHAWWRQDEMGYTDAKNAGVFRADSRAVASARERWQDDELVSYAPSALEHKLMTLRGEA